MKKFWERYKVFLIAIIIVLIIFGINFIREKNREPENEISKQVLQQINDEMLRIGREKEEQILKELEAKRRQRAAEKVSLPVYSHSPCKLWMDYRTITNTDSIQWSLIQQAEVGADGILRIDGYVCVALGRNYGNLGDKFIFQIGDKKVKCIFTDMKADWDTLNNEGWLDPYGNVLEIIVDKYQISSTCRQMGDMNYSDALAGSVKNIWKEE